MALQLNGGSYGLRQVSSSDKTVLLMKLTDSALRIIESYQDNSNNVRMKPSIQFQGNQGVIQIPVPGSEHEVQKFSFAVSNLPHSAGVDCLQQIRSGHTGRVECFGSIQQKITVNAKDDSYDMTRQRMTLAKKEEQKTSTKVIKQPGSKMGKMYKKTGKSRIVDKTHHPSKSRLSPDTRAPTPPISRLTPTLMGRSSSPLTQSNQESSAPSAAAGSGRNKTKPMMTISSSSTNQNNIPIPQNNTNTTSAVAARPLWDRVTHLLALRSYKYPEIVLRLKRDKPPDNGRLQEILSKVASTRNTSGGGTEYCLLRNIYNDIDPDSWPGYSEFERKAVKKKLSEQSGITENRKRSYTNTLSPPEALSESAHDEEYSNPTSKKQRVSHIRGRPNEALPPNEPDKPKPHSPPKKSTGISFGTTHLPAQPAKNHLSSKKDSRNYEKQQRNNQIAKNTFDVMSEKPPPEQLPKTDKYSNHNRGSQHNSDDEEDYLKKYTQISSLEQRDRYKKDFYAEYQEYLGHHSNVATVSDRFAQLQRKLNKHEKGTDEYKAISRQVIQEYKKTKKNDGYHKERARLQFLHRKLQHIKELVNKFDRHKISNRSDTDTICLPTKTATKVA